MAAAITSTELRDRIASDAPLHILDARPWPNSRPRISTARSRAPRRAQRPRFEGRRELDRSSDIVLVCRSGQRSTQAAELLLGQGVTNGAILENGITDWEAQGYDVKRGVQRWDLERQVRLVGGPSCCPRCSAASRSHD